MTKKKVQPNSTSVVGFFVRWQLIIVGTTIVSGLATLLLGIFAPTFWRTEVRMKFENKGDHSQTPADLNSNLETLFSSKSSARMFADLLFTKLRNDKSSGEAIEYLRKDLEEKHQRTAPVEQNFADYLTEEMVAYARGIKFPNQDQFLFLLKFDEHKNLVLTVNAKEKHVGRPLHEALIGSLVGAFAFFNDTHIQEREKGVKKLTEIAARIPPKVSELFSKSKILDSDLEYVREYFAILSEIKQLQIRQGKELPGGEQKLSPVLSESLHESLFSSYRQLLALQSTNTISKSKADELLLKLNRIRTHVLSEELLIQEFLRFSFGETGEFRELIRAAMSEPNSMALSTDLNTVETVSADFDKEMKKPIAIYVVAAVILGFLIGNLIAAFMQFANRDTPG